MTVSPIIQDPPGRLFASFESGQHCGRATLSLDKEFSSRLNTLFDAATCDEHMPMSAVPLLLMRAYTTVITDRPPGNIHVGQVCNLVELPKHDAVMEVSVTCAHKEMRKGRRILQFDVTLTDSRTRNLLISGLSTVFWAA